MHGEYDDEDQTIEIGENNAKEAWWWGRKDGRSIMGEGIRYSPFTEQGRVFGIHMNVVNRFQPHYTGLETCQICEGMLDETRSVQASYKKRNLCKSCRSHTKAFLHRPSRWVFKYCKGCCRFEHISFFGSPFASSCEEKQVAKSQWAKDRRKRVHGKDTQK